MRYKKTIFIILLCIISFFAGIISANKINFSRNDYKKTFNYENISINVYNEYNKENYEKYIDNLEMIPKDLIKNCNNIFFTSEDLNKKFDLGFNSKVVAISYGKDIYINTDYYRNNVLIHEMYHVYDYSNDWISKTDEFLEIYERNKEVFEVSPGNNTDSYEFFATCGENFFLNSNLLKETELFTFFENLNIQH